MITAELKNYRQSPRKVRLVIDAIRGKKALEASVLLQFITKRASHPIKKLLDSAIANAKHNFKLDPENLYVKAASVDSGIVMKRFMPRARGSASQILKKTSQVKIVLAEKVAKVAKNKKSVTKNKK